MDEKPRQELRKLILQYGHEVIDDPRRLEGLLRDCCGKHKREIFILASALKERIPHDLLSWDKTIPLEIAFDQLTKRLVDHLAMTEEAAIWGVETWALALNLELAKHPSPPKAKVSIPSKSGPSPRVMPPTRLILPPWLLPAMGIAGLLLIIGLGVVFRLELIPSQAARDHLDRGIAYETQGDQVSALVEYTQAIEIDPGLSEALLRRSRLYLQQGNYDQALKDAAAVVAISPEVAEAYYLTGQAYFSLGRQEEAISAFDRAIAADANFAKAYYQRGLIYASQAIYGQAIADFTQAIQNGLSSAEVFYQRGQAYYARGDLENAIADYGKAIDYQPSVKEAYLGRGRALADSGDLLAALADFNQAVHLDNKDAKAYYQRGEVLYRLHDIVGASEDYQRALALGLKTADLYSALALTHLDSGNVTAALQNFTQAIQIKPHDAGLYYQRGLARSRIADLAGAIEDFNQAIEISPANGGLYYSRALARSQQEDLQGAFEDYTQAIRLSSDSAVAAYAYIGRGAVQSKQGNIQAALQDYTQATKLAPDNPQAWNNLCWLGSLNGQADSFSQACDEAVRLAPQNGNFRDSRGLARALQGDYQGAIEDFSFFVTWSLENNLPEAERTQRQSWIEALKQGENPFDEVTLQSLILSISSTSEATASSSLPTPLPASPTPAASQEPPPCLEIGKLWRSIKDEMTLVCVPAGAFIMGSKDDDPLAKPNEKPAHRVYLNAFWIDQTEITNAMYARCVTAGVCSLPENNTFYADPAYGDHPVIASWEMAQAYCSWAGRRLPSEAEWEKAARGTDERPYPWGENISCQKANYSGCVGNTKPVGSYTAYSSPYGVLDMAGNLWEWVADWYQQTYYADSPYINPQGPPSGTRHVLRGGAWDSFDLNLRTVFRLGFANPNSGFRCVYP